MAAPFVVSVLGLSGIRTRSVAGGHEDPGFPAGRDDGLYLELVPLMVVGQASSVGHLAQFVPGVLVDQVHGVEGPVHADSRGTTAAAWAEPPPVV